MRITSWLSRARQRRTPLFRPTTIAERRQPALLWCIERQAIVAGTQIDQVSSWDFALGAPMVMLETSWETTQDVLLDCAAVGSADGV
jgi:hypothetical protein